MSKSNQTRQAGSSRPTGPPSNAGNQRQRILDLLRERGAVGVTNLELNRRVCLRYGARIFELRRMGFQIETHAESEGVFRFTLRREPLQLKPLTTFQQRSREFEARKLPLFGSVRSEP